MTVRGLRRLNSRKTSREHDSEILLRYKRESSPEKAGVGGSIPSLATTF